MCERVGEDSRYGIGYVDIQVGIMNSLEWVCLPLHEHLGGGVTQCRKIQLLCIAHPVVGSPFQVEEVFRKTMLTKGRF